MLYLVTFRNLKGISCFCYLSFNFSMKFKLLYFFINSLMDWNDTELENSQKAKKESVINSHHQKP